MLSYEALSIKPLSSLIAASNFPLADYLPMEDIEDALAGIYYTDALAAGTTEQVRIELHLAINNEIELQIPGCEAFSVVVGSGAGWTFVDAVLHLGSWFGLELRGVGFGLQISPSILRDEATGQGARISTQGDLVFSTDGVRLINGVGASLASAFLCGTEVRVSAESVRLVFGAHNAESFLTDPNDEATPDETLFQGAKFDALQIRLPSDYIQNSAGGDLVMTVENAAIGTTGFTGAVTADLTALDAGSCFGLDARFQGFSLEIIENSIVSAKLEAHLHLEAFDEDGSEKWIAIDASFGAGGVTAALAAAQPPEAGAQPGALASLEYDGIARFLLQGLRISRNDDGVWAFLFSGSLELLIDGATWPEVGFDEIGVTSNGELLLPEGGGVVFGTPLVVDWHFAKLTIPKFRFGRPAPEQASPPPPVSGDDPRLQIALSGEVALVEGMPAGASVEGLTVTWNPRTGAKHVAFTGIGVELGVPGSFTAAMEIAYEDTAEGPTFKGRGQLELVALDMKIDVACVVGRHQTSFPYLYLMADAKVMPYGIPIGTTGLVIYGFQGLLAKNMRLASSRPSFPATDLSNWTKEAGKNALGVGIVVGTTDKGYAFSAKGMLIVAFPDLTILVQAQATFLRPRTDLVDSMSGGLEALMLYAQASRDFLFDIQAKWGFGSLLEVSGAAEAQFRIGDPEGWHLHIGASNKPIAAKAVRLGEKWLFNAGHWLEIGQGSVATGASLDVGLRYAAAGFFIEIAASAEATMAIDWRPNQYEGSLELQGRLEAGYRGLSVSFHFFANAMLRAERPLDFRLHAEACFRALLFKGCKRHTFAWERRELPDIPPAILTVSAAPRHWTPVPGPSSVDTGVVRLAEASPGVEVWPHSEIVIDFARPMFDRVNGNEGLTGPLVLEGFGAGGAQALGWELTAVELVANPGPNQQSFGPHIKTWQKLGDQGTRLALLSSVRFGHDGSRSEVIDPSSTDYCTPPSFPTRIITVPLDGLAPGHGELPGGFPYVFEANDGSSGYDPGDLTNVGQDEPPGTLLRSGESVTMRLPKYVDGVATVTVQTSTGALSLDAVDGVVVITPTSANQRLLELSFDSKARARSIGFGPYFGTLQSDNEEWSVAEGAKLLPPQTDFRLRLQTKWTFRDVEGVEHSELVEHQYDFRTRGAPEYVGALDNYIAGSYPAPDERPVFTGYDFAVRFHDPYVVPLYDSSGYDVVLRLKDANGAWLSVADKPYVPTQRSLASRNDSLVQRQWKSQYAAAQASSCIPPTRTIPSEELTGIRAQPGDALHRNEQYILCVCARKRADDQLRRSVHANAGRRWRWRVLGAPLGGARALGDGALDRKRQRQRRRPRAEHRRDACSRASGGTGCHWRTDGLIVVATWPRGSRARRQTRGGRRCATGSRDLQYLHCDVRGCHGLPHPADSSGSR